MREQPHGTRFRYLGGCRCVRCRVANADYSRRYRADREDGQLTEVFARKARRHLLALERSDMTLEAISSACGLGRLLLRGIRSRRVKKIRRRQELAILAVHPDSEVDAAIVPAGPTWEKLRELESEGFTKSELARRLGLKCGRLYLSRKRIRKATKARVDAFYDTIMAGG